MTTQSPELTEFYRAYLTWFNDGAKTEDSYPFTRCNGLCLTLERYSDIRGWNSNVLDAEMVCQFMSAGLNRGVPFNPNLADYFNELSHHWAHLNPARIEWVKSHAAV